MVIGAWGWGGCMEYCEHGGICMVALPHDVHHTGTHPFVVAEEENDEPIQVTD